MRVLLIHQSFVDHEHPGGTRHYELGLHLVERGHQVTIVAGNLNYLTGRQFVESRRLVAAQVLSGIRVLRAYVYPSLHRSFVWRVVSFLSFMVTSLIAGLRAGPVDVVWGTSPPIFQLLPTWVVAVIRRRPMVLEIRDLWPEFAIDMGILKNRFMIAMARRTEAFFYRMASHIVVNSPAYRDYLAKKGVPDTKISIIPNGVDPSMFSPHDNGSQVRRELGIDGQFVVTYTGALGQANDIPTILKAAERLATDHGDVHFLLVGDGKERANLQSQAGHLKNVTFTGTFPKNRMGQVLAASDACLATLRDIPMFRTTYPNKVFDYMAAARPTILSIDGVIRQVVEEAGSGICIPPGDDQALAEAVLQLQRDPSKARSMGNSGRQYVVKHFDRARHAQELECLLRGFAGR